MVEEFKEIKLEDLDIFKKAGDYGLKQRPLKALTLRYIEKIEKRIKGAVQNKKNTEFIIVVRILERILPVLYDMLHNSSSIKYNLKQFAMLKNVKRAYESLERLIPDIEMQEIYELFSKKIEEEEDQLKRIEHYRIILEYTGYLASIIEYYDSAYSGADDTDMIRLVEVLLEK